MPFKDPEKKLAYDRAWHKAHRESGRASGARDRAKHPDRIRENNARRIFVNHQYLGVSGMTPKQRAKFQKELNGETE